LSDHRWSYGAIQMSASWVRIDLRGVHRHALPRRNMWSSCERAALNEAGTKHSLWLWWWWRWWRRY